MNDALKDALLQLVKAHAITGREVGGLIYGALAIPVTNDAPPPADPAEHRDAYRANKREMIEAMERFGKRLPDALWHSHLESPALSKSDVEALQPWVVLGIRKHYIVTVNGEVAEHQL